MNFRSETGCDEVVLSWTVIAGYSYSIEETYDGSKRIYNNLTNGSLSLELPEDYSSSVVFLDGKSMEGGSPTYQQNVSFFYGMFTQVYHTVCHFLHT